MKMIITLLRVIIKALFLIPTFVFSLLRRCLFELLDYINRKDFLSRLLLTSNPLDYQTSSYMCEDCPFRLKFFETY